MPLWTKDTNDNFTHGCPTHMGSLWVGHGFFLSMGMPEPYPIILQVVICVINPKLTVFANKLKSETTRSQSSPPPYSHSPSCTTPHSPLLPITNSPTIGTTRWCLHHTRSQQLRRHPSLLRWCAQWVPARHGYPLGMGAGMVLCQMIRYGYDFLWPWEIWAWVWDCCTRTVPYPLSSLTKGGANGYSPYVQLGELKFRKSVELKRKRVPQGSKFASV